MNAALLREHYARIADAPDAIARLRRFVLDLAVRGKLVEQEAGDEPATDLLAKSHGRVLKGRKASVQDVMAETPYSLPATWRWAPVSAVFEYDAGRKVEPKSLRPDGWLLELEDIEKDTGRLLARAVVSDRASQSTKSEFAKGDILYGKLRPYLNKVFVADEDGYSTTEIVALRPLVTAYPPYCALALRRPDFVEYVSRLGQGTKMPRLRTEDALVAPFPLPPLTEQHRIVAKVDELMALCDQLEAARADREHSRDRFALSTLARLNEPDPATFANDARFALANLTPLTTRADQIKQMRQTILSLAVRGKLVEQDPNDEPASPQLQRISDERDDLVQARTIRRDKPLDPIAAEQAPFEIPSSWVWSKIGDAALFTQYGTSEKSGPSEHGVPVLAMGNIQDGKVIWSNEKRIPDTSDELPSLYLKKFDLLYNRTNSAELVGKTGIYLGEDDCRTFASYLIRIRCSNKNSVPTYFNLAMNAPIFRETQIVPLIKKQTGQANVNGTALKNMLVPLPPLSEQRRIVAMVDQLLKLCDQLETSITTGEQTRSRLLEAVLHQTLQPAAAAELALA